MQRLYAPLAARGTSPGPSESVPWLELSAPPEPFPIMLVVNTEYVPGHEVTKILGLVQGNTIRTKHLGRDIAAGLKNLVGGELRGYTELLTEARRQAIERMMAQAKELGADAIVNVRFTTSAVAAGAAELYAYGTAVILTPNSVQG